MQMANEMEDSQSSASSNRVITPPPLTPYRRPTPGKGMHYGPNKRDPIEEKLLKIIEKPENESDEDEMFCLSLVASLQKIPRPSKEGVYKVVLQQTLYNCMYGSQASQCRSDTASASTSSNSCAYAPASTKL